MEKTPIQEAIEIIKARIPKKPNCHFDDGLERAYEEAVEELQALLPKEKEFVEKVWDAARDETVYPDTTKGRGGVGGQLVTSGYTHDKQQFINQLYPEK